MDDHEPGCIEAEDETKILRREDGRGFREGVLVVMGVAVGGLEEAAFVSAFDLVPSEREDHVPRRPRTEVSLCLPVEVCTADDAFVSLARPGGTEAPLPSDRRSLLPPPTRSAPSTDCSMSSSNSTGPRRKTTKMIISLRLFDKKHLQYQRRHQ